MRQVLADPGYAREAAVAAAADGTLCAYVSWRGAGESVVLQRRSDAAWSSSVVRSGRKAIRRPAVLPNGTVAWSEASPAGSRVIVQLPGGQRARMPIGSAAPTLGVDSAGRAIVAFERRGAVELRDAASARLLAKAPGATDPVLAGDALAYESDGRIFLLWPWQPARRRPLALSTRPAVAASPAIARLADGRLAIAWHESNVAEGLPDLPRWVSLRIVDGDDVAEPRGPMPGRDLEKRGEDQGLEFPELVPTPGGGLVLFARGSHCFYRQELSASGWGDLVALSDVAWGCRGRRPSGCLLPDGRLLVARREREGIVVEDFAAPAGRGPIPVRTVRSADVVHARPPTAPRFSAHGLSAFFGDLHMHSAHSDGTGTAAERYRASRDRYRDDFAALTDHESFLGKRTGPGEWSFLEDVADRFHEPGRFATLFAYEWTARMHPGPGHKVVYWPRRGLGVLSRDDPKSREGKDLLALVRRKGGLAFPHHVGWTGADTASHDPRVQSCWEICSCHGCYEHKGHPIGHRGELAGQFVRENLDSGLRFGFVAASDGHGLLWHHGISRKRDPFRTGLAGVLAKHPTRAAIFDALRRRRCYATSGAKIGLSVRAGGRPMGSEIRASGPLVFEVRFRGTARVDRLEVVTTGGRTMDFEPSTDRGAVRLAVALDPDANWAYFYVRLAQEDGEWAWSSPIWLDRP